MRRVQRPRCLGVPALCPHAAGVPASVPLGSRRPYGVLYRSQGTKPLRSDRDKVAESTTAAGHNGEASPKSDDADDGTKEALKKPAGVLVTTRGAIANHEIVQEVGIVVGSSVKSRHVGHDLWARVQGVFGLSVAAYAEMMVDSSAEATHNLMNEASRRGANAVVRVRYETAASSDPAVWSSTFSYTLAYGTAVVVRPTKGAKQTSWRDYHSDDDDDD